MMAGAPALSVAGSVSLIAACGLGNPTRPPEVFDSAVPDVAIIDAIIDAPIDAPDDAGLPDAMDAAPPVDAPLPDSAAPPACVGALSGGTHTGTQFFPISGRIGLATTPAFYDGTFESQVFDGVSPAHDWTTIQWTPLRPTGKPLPDDDTAETGYSIGNVNMAGNVLLAHFDEASGTSFTDSSTSPAAGTCGGVSTCPTVGLPDAIYGRAVQFNGHDDCTMTDCCTLMTCGTCPMCGFEGGDRIDFPDSATLEPAELTIESWVQVDSIPDGFSTGMLFTKGHRAGADDPAEAFGSYSIEFDRATMVFKCYLGLAGQSDTDRTLIGTMPAPFAPPTGYNHVACTYGGGNYRIYVNGVLRNFSAHSEAIVYDPPTILEEGFYVGAWYAYQYLHGQLDELAIFNTALDATAIRDHFLRGNGRIRFQVRSCPDPTCSGVPWSGPDGTAASYYHEQCRPPGGGAVSLGLPSFPLDDVDCDFDGLADHPSPDPVIPPNRYIQFSARLQSLVGPAAPADASEVQLLDVTLCE